jgi:hypothetical protein
MKYKFISIITVFLLTGCLDQSWVQYGYGGARDDCQDDAASAVSAMKDVANRGDALKEKFSDCMGKKGWKITTAKPPTQQPPLVAGRRAGAMSQAPASHAEEQQDVGAGSQTQTQTPTQTQSPQPVQKSTPAASSYQPEAPSSQPAGTAAPGRYFGPR